MAPSISAKPNDLFNDAQPMTAQLNDGEANYFPIVHFLSPCIFAGFLKSKLLLQKYMHEGSHFKLSENYVIQVL